MAQDLAKTVPASVMKLIRVRCPPRSSGRCAGRDGGPAPAGTSWRNGYRQAGAFEPDPASSTRASADHPRSTRRVADPRPSTVPAWRRDDWRPIVPLGLGLAGTILVDSLWRLSSHSRRSNGRLGASSRRDSNRQQRHSRSAIGKESHRHYDPFGLGFESRCPLHARLF